MSSLMSPQDMLRKAWSLFIQQENRKHYIILGLMPVVASVLLELISPILSQTLPDISGRINLAGFGMLFGLFIVYLVLTNWYIAVLYFINVEIVMGEYIDIKMYLKKGWSKVVRLLLTHLLFGVGVFFGMLLFIVPGLLFYIWFYFAPIISITKGNGIKTSFAKSREIVGKRFWPVFMRLLVFFALYAFVALALEDVSGLLSRLWLGIAPLFNLLQVVLYYDLQKDAATAVPSTAPVKPAANPQRVFHTANKLQPQQDFPQVTKFVPSTTQNPVQTTSG